MGLDPTPRSQVLSVINMHAQVCSFSRTSKQEESRIGLLPDFLKSSNEPVELSYAILCCPVSCVQPFSNAKFAVTVCTLGPVSNYPHWDVT